MRALAALALAAVSGIVGAAEKPSPEIAWQDWSDAVFARAQAEKKLVLLDLGAVWCHWCHVMEETTYRDPEVVELIGRHFIAVRVDQDSRPDLSNRYEDYGWPATILFDASGRELVKFAGYIPPRRMASLLAATVEDPTPGPSARPEAPASAPSTGVLSPALRQELAEILAARYDRGKGGWGFAKKYLDFDSVEWCLSRARSGDVDAEKMARETLDLSRRLIDPVWGGLDQYSDSGDWDHPHYEKLLQFQAGGIETYAQAYALWRRPEDLESARAIRGYLRDFLTSPEGAFYVSQDADLHAGEHSGEYYALSDADRRSQGVPRVDTNLYARETAWGGPGAPVPSCRDRRARGAPRRREGGALDPGGARPSRRRLSPRRVRRSRPFSGGHAGRWPRLSGSVCGHRRSRLADARPGRRRLHRPDLLRRGRFGRHLRGA
jgi:thioredoxin-related protein